MAVPTLSKKWLIPIIILIGVFVFASDGLKGGPEVSVREADALLKSDPRPALLDVRERAAYDAGHIAGAQSVPLGEIKQRLESLKLSKIDPVLVYSDDGTRGPEATRVLIESGYQGALNLRGGIEGWRAAGQPVVTK